MAVSRAKILVFVDWYLPGYRAGGPIRSVANMVRELSDEFEFLIVTSDTDFGASAPYAGVTPNQWSAGPHGEQVWYCSADQLSRQTIARLLRETGHDCVYLNSFFSLPFSIWPLWLLRNTQEKVVLAPRGMLGAGALKLKAAKKKVFLLATKLLRMHQRIAWHASTDLEAAEVKALFGNSARTFTALNIPGRPQASDTTQKIKEAGKLRLFFLSRISPKKNLLEAIQWLGQLQLQPGEQILYDVYGPVDDAPYWEQCQQAIAQLNNGVEVVHRGAIANDELATYLAEAHFMLLPTRHENYGHAMLESLSLGCPLIISDQTPWRNLHAEGVGWDIELAHQATYLDVLRQCINMPQSAFTKMSEQARTFATQFTNNSAVLEQNKVMFRSVISRR